MALDSELMALVRAIVLRHASEAVRLLAESSALARARFEVGATRQAAKGYYLEEITRYIYAADTALRIAAAAYQTDIGPNSWPGAPTCGRRTGVERNRCTRRRQACRARRGGTRLRKPRPWRA